MNTIPTFISSFKEMLSNHPAFDLLEGLDFNQTMKINKMLSEA